MPLLTALEVIKLPASRKDREGKKERVGRKGGEIMGRRKGGKTDGGCRETEND